MKILVFGAGIIGSVYAAKLFQSGEDVTLLARGQKYDQLQKNGVTLRDILNGNEMQVSTPIIQQLNFTDHYDLIIISVRLDQLDSIVGPLKQNTASENLLFMMNNPDRIQWLQEQLPHKNILLGFPGVGGIYDEGTIDFVQIKEQKTTLGSLSNLDSTLLGRIKSIFEKAGFDVDVSDEMTAWLKIHAVFISCISAAIILEHGSSEQLGNNKRSTVRMVNAIKEGFRACKQLGIPVVPSNLKVIFLIMPQWFCVWYWRKALQGNLGKLAMAPHANVAKEEMKLLAKSVLKMVEPSTVPAPTIRNLLREFLEEV